VTPNLHRKFYGKSSTENCFLRKKWLTKIAKMAPMLLVNSTTAVLPPPHNFSTQQLVLLDKNNFLGKNQN